MLVGCIVYAILFLQILASVKLCRVDLKSMFPASFLSSGTIKCIMSAYGKRKKIDHGVPRGLTIKALMLVIKSNGDIVDISVPLHQKVMSCLEGRIVYLSHFRHVE